MAVKGEEHAEEAEITVDTPAPQPVEPPPAALAQTAIETNQVAVPVELIPAEVVGAASSVASTLASNQRLCTVIAPSTLAGGYTFPAQVDGIDFVVTVPAGGVVEGQAFSVPYPMTSRGPAELAGPMQPLSVESATPGVVMISPGEEVNGQWRNELCECCEVCANGMCLQGFFCTPLLLAQIMTRFHLNALGVYGPLRYHQTFWWILVIWIVYIGVLFSLIDGGPVGFVVEVLFLAFFVVIATNLRSVMRTRYDIRPECCVGCDGVLDDFCCVIWCWPCTTIQMARHTHDTYTYPYHCCTTTGLSGDAPVLIV
jgi:Cys-rich protein (TIGR01571 family)